MIFRRNIEAFGIVTLALLLGLIKCQTCDKVLCKKRDIKRIENELTDKISKLENKLDTLNTKLEDDMEIFGKMLIDTPEIKRTGFEAKVLDQLTKLNTKLNRMTENEACMRTRERFFRTYENGLVPLCEDGWLVIAYRYNGEVAFHNRTWDEYKNGFGAPHGEYFLGFEPIRSLLKREEFKLRVELGLSFRGGIRWGIAGYDLFFISEETENYELRLGDYNSTGTSNIANSLSLHTNSKFQTVDRNSGRAPIRGCSRDTPGAWWYNSTKCSQSNLFAIYPGPECEYRNGPWPCMFWTGFAHCPGYYSCSRYYPIKSFETDYKKIGDFTEMKLKIKPY